MVSHAPNSADRLRAGQTLAGILIIAREEAAKPARWPWQKRRRRIWAETAEGLARRLRESCECRRTDGKHYRSCPVIAREGDFCVDNIVYSDGRWERPFYTDSEERARGYLDWLKSGGWCPRLSRFTNGNWEVLDET